MIRQSHRAFLILAVAATGLLPLPLIGQQRDFMFHDVRPGVYLAVGTGRTVVGANAAIIVNEHEVLLVDSHITPAAARALLRELGEITSKPVRYVVNTHFHFDHAHGNQIFPHDVEIIGHEFTSLDSHGRASPNGHGLTCCRWIRVEW